MYPHFIEKILDYKKIQTNDLMTIVPSYIESFNSEPWNDRWTYETAFQRLEMMVYSPAFYGVLAFYQNQFCGAVIGEKEQYYDGMIYKIKEFWVTHQSRGTGLGTQIYNDLEAILLQQGIIRIELSTIQSHYTAGFYSKLGFQKEDNMICMKKQIKDK